MNVSWGAPQAEIDAARTFPGTRSKSWWQRPCGVVLLLALTALPLLWPTIPPLGDLPGHMGRYRVELDIASHPELRRFYGFTWQVIGNLGVDLLVVPLSPLFGLEGAVKLIAIAIPVITAGGFLWVAREVHGRVPATALFALPLAYNYPVLFGFVNFALSMGLAFVAFGLWLRLTRLGGWRLRTALFLPLSLILWVAHVYGWATLGVLAFVSGTVRLRSTGRGLVSAAWHTGLECLALAPPVLAMLVWRSGKAGGFTGDWFDWGQKGKYLVMALRDQWMIFDLASLSVLIALIIAALVSRRLKVAPTLAIPTAVLLALFVLLPRVIFGSSYADMRLVPYIYATAVLAIRPAAAAGRRWLAAVALAGAAFFLVRTAATTTSLWLYDRSYQRELAALDALPHEARLVSFVGRPCGIIWWVTRLEHIPGLALERKLAFSNEQWDMAGGQPLTVIYSAGAPYNRDPSQIVVPNSCAKKGKLTIGQSLRGFPRQAFDYVWLIRPPPYDAADVQGLQPVWRSGPSVLYRVIDRNQPGAAR